MAIEYRFAEMRNERLPALAADLVQRQVTLIDLQRVQFCSPAPTS